MVSLDYLQDKGLFGSWNSVFDYSMALHSFNRFKTFILPAKSTRVRCIFFAACLFSFTACPNLVFAQSSKKLLSFSARARADKLYRTRSSQLKRLFLPTGEGLALYRRRKEDATDGLRDTRLDSTNQLLWERSEHEAYTTSAYRNLEYFKTTRDVTHLEEISRDGEPDAAASLVLYRSAKLAHSYVLEPVFGSLYHDVLNNLRYLRDVSTFSLAQSKTGAYEIEHGEEAEVRLVQFRLRANINSLIEPNLEISENVLLRLQPFEQRILMEYRFSF